MPQLALSGVIDVGPFFGLLMVLPTLIGLPCALAGALVGIVCVFRQRSVQRAVMFPRSPQLLARAIAVSGIWDDRDKLT